MNLIFNDISGRFAVITIFSMYLIIPSGVAYAKKAEQTAKIKIKCHVELVGGKDSIHFGIIKSERKTRYAQWLEGKKIATGFSKQKQQVYKVIECTKLNDKFINPISQRVDENTAR
jgi:hypothetical protein